MQSPPPHNFALKGGFPSHKLNDILPQFDTFDFFEL